VNRGALFYENGGSLDEIADGGFREGQKRAAVYGEQAEKRRLFAVRAPVRSLCLQKL
jgi:hypothetical protein